VLADDELKRQAEERVGTILEGKWRLDALLGVGGMACVYSATHRNTKRVAVKLLHPHLSFDRSIRERFLREGYAANRVKHPGVVVVHDEDTTQEGAAFLVMELLEGEGVGERWQRHGCRLPPEEVMSLADQLLDTLAAAHEKGIVHRDIKPENLFVTGDGQLKVLDFGIARLRELSGSISATRTGSMLGTPAFMAPEQAKGRWNEVDALTDLWAVGATMFTLITGEYVHQGNTANEMLALTITRPARSIGSLTPDLHPALVALVDKALAYHKHERWSDAGAMRKALSIARIEVARSGGPFAGGAVLATTNYDATISPRPRVRASPDAATVHSEDHSRPASTPSASTTARSPTIAGRIVRLRFLVASVTGVLVVAVLAVLLRPSAKEPEPMTGSGLARPEITNIPQAAVPAVMPSGVSLPSVAMVVEDAGLSAEADAGAAKTLAADRPHAAKPRRRPGEPAPGATAPAKASSDPFARRR
jgi:serine/threonine-protein kinase